MFTRAFFHCNTTDKQAAITTTSFSILIRFGSDAVIVAADLKYVF
jgi:hypothetical protein